MIENFAEYLHLKGLSKNTISHYLRQTENFLCWLEKENIETVQTGATDVTAYLNYLQKKGNSNKSRSYQLGILKHFFDYEIHREHREDNPAKRIKIRGSKTKKLYPVLSAEELEDLYKKYEVPEENDERKKYNWFTACRRARQRNKIILSFLIHQALTTKEITALKTNDLNLREGKIRIAGGRKSAERILEAKPHQILELMEYQYTTRKEFLIEAGHTHDNGIFFYKVENLWKEFTRDLKKICLQLINIQQIRSSVITNWLKEHNLRKVQYMAGHKYVSSTEKYLAQNVDELQSEIEKYHPLG